MVRVAGRPTIASLESYTDVTYEAVDLFNRGDYEGAVERLREMARVNPDNIKVHEVLADAYLKTGRIDRAAEEVAVVRRLAARLHPDLAPDEGRTFEGIAAEADAAEGLESRYVDLLGCESVSEMLANSGVASHLSVKLMAAGEYVAAERILLRYGERLAALRDDAGLPGVTPD